MIRVGETWDKLARLKKWAPFPSKTQGTVLPLLTYSMTVSHART